jgi:hypothetical protein
VAFVGAAFFGCLGAGAQVVAIYVSPTSSPPPISPQGQCTVRGNLFLCADPDPVKTPDVGNGQNVQIDWYVKSSGWMFVDQKGIVITDTKRKWNVKQQSLTQYTAKGKKDGIFYKYQINVTDGTNPLSPWDPTIRN